MAVSGALFRLSRGLPRDPAVDAWFEERHGELAAIARHWFDTMRACDDPDYRELIHDGCPVACLGDTAMGYVNVFTRHVNVGFFRGAELPDPSRLLEGTGRSMRHVKLRPGGQVDEAALEALVRAAYAHLRITLDS